MRIGELARRTNTTTRALRHYEQKGLLKPARSGNRYREYRPDAVEAVRRIRWLLSAGLTTRAIQGVLPCLMLEPLEEIRCASLRRKLERELARIELRAADLRRSARLLRGALAAGQ